MSSRSPCINIRAEVQWRMDLLSGGRNLCLAQGKHRCHSAERSCRGFGSASPVLNQSGEGHALGLSWTFWCISGSSHRSDLSGNVHTALCWSDACGSRYNFSADTDSSGSAFPLEGHLFSGAFILAVCNVLNTLCGDQFLLSKQRVNRERTILLRRTWHPLGGNIKYLPGHTWSGCLWSLVKCTMSVGGLPLIFIGLWQEYKWTFSAHGLPPLLLTPDSILHSTRPCTHTRTPQSTSSIPIHILHKNLPFGLPLSLGVHNLAWTPLRGKMKGRRPCRP